MYLCALSSNIAVSAVLFCFGVGGRDGWRSGGYDVDNLDAQYDLVNKPFIYTDTLLGLIAASSNDDVDLTAAVMTTGRRMIRGVGFLATLWFCHC